MVRYSEASVKHLNESEKKEKSGHGQPYISGENGYEEDGIWRFCGVIDMHSGNKIVLNERW